MFRRNLLTGAAILWTVGILVATWMPPSSIPHSELEEASIFRFIKLDKIAHAALFFGFGLLWPLAARARRIARIPWLGITVAGLVIAVVSEIGQATPWVKRDAELSDIVADMVGQIAGSIALYWSMRKKPRSVRTGGSEAIERVPVVAEATTPECPIAIER